MSIRTFWTKLDIILSNILKEKKKKHLAANAAIIHFMHKAMWMKRKMIYLKKAIINKTLVSSWIIFFLFFHVLL